MLSRKRKALNAMKSHLKDFEQSNSMAHKTAWLVGAIELVKKYNGKDSVFYHTLSANDFYIQASPIEDKTIIRDKLYQKEKFIKLTFEQAIKHIEINGIYEVSKTPEPEHWYKRWQNILLLFISGAVVAGVILLLAQGLSLKEALKLLP